MNSNGYIKSYLNEFEKVFLEFKLKCGKEILDSARMINETFLNGNKLLICGNGGSAADAQHFSAEFVSSFSKKINRRSLPAVALTTNTSIITAYANDYSFDGIFSRQVESLGVSGDALLVITTSGKSKNCLLAVEQARKQKMKTLAFTKIGSVISKKVDLALQIPSNNTQHIQELHLISYHMIAGIVESLITRK